jgi:hypothetical protein
MRHYITVGHAENTRESRKGSHKVDSQCGIINSLKSIYPIGGLAVKRVKDPGARGGDPGINDPVQAVYKIFRGNLPSSSALKSRMIMEKNILSKMEGINGSCFIYLPSPGNTGPDLQLLVQLNKAVEQLVDGPDDGLVPGKCRIQRRYTFGFVIAEDILPGLLPTVTGKHK